MVQDALEHFALDLKHNEKRASIKGDPIGFFMGIMQRGMYVPPSNFVHPAEVEIDHYLAQQEARIARMQEKLAKKEKLDFEVWLLETTESQRREIAPHAQQDMSEMQKGILKNYWKALLSRSNELLNQEDSVKNIQKQIEQSLSGNA